MSKELSQLVTTYQSEGWKHFNKWLEESIQNSMVKIVDPKTPKEEIDMERAIAYAYTSILDKVEGDKQIFKQDVSSEE